MKTLVALMLWVIASLPLMRSRCSVERHLKPIDEQVVVVCPSYLRLFSISEDRKSSNDVEFVTSDGTKLYRRAKPVLDLLDIDLAKTAVQREADGSWAIHLSVVDRSATRMAEWVRLHAGERYVILIDQDVHGVGDVPPPSLGFLIRGFPTEASVNVVAKRILAGGCAEPAIADAGCSAMDFETAKPPTSRPGVDGCPAYIQLFSVCEHRIRPSDIEVIDRAGRHWFRRARPVVDLSDFELDETSIGRDDNGKPCVMVSVGDRAFERVRAWSRAHRDEYGAMMIDNRVQTIAVIRPLGNLLVVGTFDDKPSAEAVRERIRRGGCEN